MQEQTWNTTSPAVPAGATRPGEVSPEPPAVAVYDLPQADAGGTTPAAAEVERAWNEPLLRQNAIWFCRLRWMVVSVLGAAGLAGFFPESLASVGLALRPDWPLAAALLLAALNVVFVRLAQGSDESARAIHTLLWAQIVSDLLVLTAVIHCLGRDLPAAPFMYLFHIILACIVFPPRASLAVAALAAGFYLASVVLESAGWVPALSVLARPALSTGGANPPGELGVGSMLLIWVVIWYLVSRLAGRLRHREEELALTNLRLKASSEERANHMLQTTHQLKAPFAAIHAQTQLLLGDYCGALPEAARDVVYKISSRCLALSRQIQEMLQLANLRSQGQSAPPRKPIDLAQLIEATVARIEPAARQRGIQVERALEPVRLHAVEDHWTMLLDNLVVNAVIYSHDHGVVRIGCHHRDPAGATVTVRDHGIGIPRDKLPRIFDDYYRTNEAVTHNRTSTGLGLAIVRQAARAIGVAVRVESAPGWGTCVTLTFPAGSPPLHSNAHAES